MSQTQSDGRNDYENGSGYMLVFFLLGFLIYAFLYGTAPKIGAIIKAVWRA